MIRSASTVLNDYLGFEEIDYNLITRSGMVLDPANADFFGRS
jgi:hypothetical protein